MPDQSNSWEQALDLPGSADKNAMRLSAVVALLIVGVAGVVLTFSEIPLAPFPLFSGFHASFIFLVNGITGLVLLGQFHYRRRLIYAVLATAYLFASLVMMPFLLTFPGTLKENAPFIGGPQSSIWIWNLWHLVFPALVLAALLLQQCHTTRQIPEQQITTVSAAAVGTALLLALAAALLVTQFQESLPLLIAPNSPGLLTPTFYATGGLSIAITAVSALLCWYKGRQQQTILYIWLAVVLLASLVEIAASLGSTMRYTVGWYFSRVAAMTAASVLLLIFLNQLNKLYQRLISTMNDLLVSNKQLASLLLEKEALVASLRRSEEQIRQLAYYDPLTELPNRRLLLDRLSQALNQAKRHHYALAIMFMDLDQFKQVNDTLGHDAGDKLLVQVAARITACLRKGDTASRSGGDEFVIVLPEITHPQDAALVAEKIIAILHAPIDIDGKPIKASISIGIAIYPIDGEDDLRDLMQKADKAMYAAKQDGRNRFRFYSSEIDINSPGSSVP